MSKHSTKAKTPRIEVSSKATTNTGSTLFPETEWLVISKAREPDDVQAAGGLQELAIIYWRPLYLYLRKRGESHEDASDAVQGFFEHVLSTNFLEHVDRDGGKFRSYLLKSLERWRSRRRVRDGAQKRGQQFEHVQLEVLDEFREVAERSEEISPEIAYDRQWGRDMVARAIVAVKEIYAERSRSDWFEALVGGLPGGGGLDPYPELAARLDANEGAVRKAVFDLRSTFAEKLREIVRATVCNSEDTEGELRYLVSLMRKG